MVSKPESNETATDKKRRKTSNSNATDNSSTSAKISKEDVYMNTIAFEEQEASKRSPVKDANLFHATCDELRAIFADIARLKSDNSDDAKMKIADKRIEGSLAFVLLKKLNRLDKVRIREGREALHKEKLRVDSNRLQLQNLLYEAEHLKREVQRCFMFKSQDEEIELVPVEEFYAQAPASVSRPESTKTDEHARRIARLEWELRQRKELHAHLKELLTLKQAVEKDIIAKTARLDSLGPRLRDLLIATRPLQEALEMPIEKGWKIRKTVRLLPQPLYLLYANVTAYGEACDNFLATSIQGDEEEAKQMAAAVNSYEAEIHCGSSSHSGNHSRDRADSDNDENEHEVDRGMKKRHHRGHMKPNLDEQRREKLFKPHPLSVTITIRAKDCPAELAADHLPGPGLLLTFSYLPNMQVVTVNIALLDLHSSGVAAGDVLSTESVLNELFRGDKGEECPNPKIQYQLQDLSIQINQLMRILKDKELGKPFLWAQKLCGLEHTSAAYTCISSDTGNEPLDVADKLHEKIPCIVRAVRSRWEARLKLYKQIHDLESKMIDTSINDERGHPIRISSTVLQWSSISFEDYVSSGVAKMFLEDAMATASDLYFRAIVIRGSAKLECYICVPCRFPDNSPLWSFSLNWNGKHTASCNSSVREMEYWCNSLSAADHLFDILPKQLKRAMSCFDIYLETEGPYYTPAEFTQDKSFLKPFRGRTRAQPFRIAPNGSSSLFTQI
ncbi:THO complex subunit 5 homolog [Anopheles marshallii]|uniref:THO complex subunit 5 homolog n=1 Tax=Anopheles marshallii TaxID=1521116 RepID=UPI00237C3BDA|nr:THO complex subunit 5 homolog [Anopheles marshallii]